MHPATLPRLTRRRASQRPSCKRNGGLRTHGSSDISLFAVMYRATSSKLQLPELELQATEEGRAALAAWRPGDDTHHERADAELLAVEDAQDAWAALSDKERAVRHFEEG